MNRLLLIRFSSLGDLCLLGWAAAARRDGLAPDRPEQVTLVTKPVYAELMRRVRGIDAVAAPGGTGMADVAHLAGRLRKEGFDSVLDAHNVLRSHLLLGLMRRRPDRRLAKDTAARLVFMSTGRPGPALRRTMADRFRDVVACPGTAAPGSEMVPPLASCAETRDPQPILGVAPGAMWDTKRWPPQHFAALARTFVGQTKARIRIFLGPREQPWFDASALAELASGSGAEIIRERPLVEVASLLAGCTVLLTNDSGLLHLAEAVGTPVLALFGPTVRAFGYYPRLDDSRVLEKDMDCRPCSRNGKRPCHRGDQACLADLGPEEAAPALSAMWEQIMQRNPA